MADQPPASSFVRASTVARRSLLALVLLALVAAFGELGIVGRFLPEDAKLLRIVLPSSTLLLTMVGVFLWRHWYLMVSFAAALVVLELGLGRRLGHQLLWGYIFLLVVLLFFGYFMALLVYIPFRLFTPPWTGEGFM